MSHRACVRAESVSCPPFFSYRRNRVVGKKEKKPLMKAHHCKKTSKKRKKKKKTPLRKNTSLVGRQKRSSLPRDQGALHRRIQSGERLDWRRKIEVFLKRRKIKRPGIKIFPFCSLPEHHRAVQRDSAGRQGSRKIRRANRPDVQ